VDVRQIMKTTVRWRSRVHRLGYRRSNTGG